MKNLSLLFLSFFFMLSFSQLKSQKFNLTVKLENLKNDKGVVWVALYNSEKGWMKTQYKGTSSNISNKNAQVIFTDIPAGTYAVSTFHDENKNKKLDTNAIGIPKEEYGFSNNPSAMFGPPSYSKAQFSINGNKIIRIDFD